MKSKLKPRTTQEDVNEIFRNNRHSLEDTKLKVYDYLKSQMSKQEFAFITQHVAVRDFLAAGIDAYVGNAVQSERNMIRTDPVRAAKVMQLPPARTYEPPTPSPRRLAQVKQATVSNFDRLHGNAPAHVRALWFDNINGILLKDHTHETMTHYVATLGKQLEGMQAAQNYGFRLTKLSAAVVAKDPTKSAVPYYEILKSEGVETSATESGYLKLKGSFD
jgi:hypothetical protein